MCNYDSKHQEATHGAPGPEEPAFQQTVTRALNSGGSLAIPRRAAYALFMNSQAPAPAIYHLRIVLRTISPLIWQRLSVRSDTTLAQLHCMLQLLFAWSNEHLYCFHIFGKDFDRDDIDTPHTRRGNFGLHRGERFRYVSNFSAPWQCDIRLEATGPWDPVLSGLYRWPTPCPPEDVPDAWAYLALRDAHRTPPVEATPDLSRDGASAPRRPG